MERSNILHFKRDSQLFKTLLHRCFWVNDMILSLKQNHNAFCHLDTANSIKIVPKQREKFE